MQPQDATGLEGFPSGLQAAREIPVFRVFSFDRCRLCDGFSFAIEETHGRLMKQLLKWSLLATGGPVTAAWRGGIARPRHARPEAKGVGRARVAPRGNALATAALRRPPAGAGQRRVQLLAGQTVRRHGTVW